MTRFAFGPLPWLALFIVAPLLLSDFYVGLLDYIMISAVIVIGIVLLTGVIGMVSFGQAAFAGLGAYTSAYLAVAYGVSPWLALPAGLVVTGFAAVLIGLITLRMSGHFLVLATLAWGISFFYLVGSLPYFGGQNGYAGVPVLNFFGTELTNDRSMYYLILAMLVATVWMSRNLLDSTMGRAIRSIRYGVAIGDSVGANTFALRLLIFVLAAVYAGLAGWLYAHLQHFINPTPFSLEMGIEYLFMAVIGGASSVWGGILGAGVVTLVDRMLQAWLPRLIGQAGNFSMVVFGVVMLIVLQTARQGLWPFLAAFNRRKSREYQPRRPTGETGAFPAPGTTVLNVENAVKQFGGLTAVNELTFNVEAGRILGLVGPNGAGKSTMFNLITGLIPASSGNISFLGKNIVGKPSRDIARMGIGRTFQHVKLVPTMTVLENAAVGSYIRSKTGLFATLLRLDRTAERRALEEAAYQLERCGLLALQGELASILPLGQQRILEIARVLSLHPVLLLLDEPAAGLRYQEKQELAKLLLQLKAEGAAILLVEHDMDFIRQVADGVVVMQYGQKLAEGSVADMQRNVAVREAYLGVD